MASNGTSHGDQEHVELKRFFSLMSNPNNEQRANTVKQLKRYVEKEAREGGSERFGHFMTELTGGVFQLVNSATVAGQTGGILVIDELVTLDYDDKEYMIVRFANALRILLQQHNDRNVLTMASRALGHLVRSGSAFTVDIVEFEVKQSLEWLEGSEGRRRAAVLILKELAANTPTLFNVHVTAFLKGIWSALRDSKVDIRQGADEALSACLDDIAKRAASWRQQCYEMIFKEALRGVSSKKKRDVAMVHGSLLAIGQLLLHTGNFLQTQFKPVFDIVLKYKSHSNSLVKAAVIQIIPRLAALAPKQFVESYFEEVLSYLLSSLKNSSTQDSAFIALGQLTITVGDGTLPHLARIMTPVIDEVAPKKRRRNAVSSSALQCLGMIIHALGPQASAYLKRVVADIFLADDLSPPLVSVLNEMAAHVPGLLPDIQERLLSRISAILFAFDPQRDSRGPPKEAELTRHGIYGSAKKITANGTQDDEKKSVSPMLTGVTQGAPPRLVLDRGRSLTSLTLKSRQRSSDAQAEAELQLLELALSTLGMFDFRGRKMLPFVQEYVLQFLEDHRPQIRKRAADTCVRLLLSSGDSTRYKHTVEIIFGMLHKLVTCAVADPDPSVRFTVISCLSCNGMNTRRRGNSVAGHAHVGDVHRRGDLDRFLAQQHILSRLFVALNDEVIAVREVAVSCLGRLTRHNPAFVLPALRKTLIQLLSELKQRGVGTHGLEQSAKLMGHLIVSCTDLVKPYVGAILEVLLPKLKDSRDTMTSCILQTLGALATIAGETMIPCMGQIIPVIISTLTHKTSLDKRQIALRTLGQLVESTGMVIDPYLLYPTLLPTVLRSLKGEQSWSVRREVHKVLGIIGALDPHQYKVRLQPLESQVPAAGSSSRDQGADAVAQHKRGPATMLLPSMLAKPEDYYPSVAISALMRVLGERGLQQHHSMVLKAVMFIFKSLGMKCVRYLPQTVPAFLEEMRVCEDSLREQFFQQLGNLVRIVKQHIRNYSNPIFGLITEFWDRSELLGSLLFVVEEIAMAVKDEFKDQLPRLVPPMLEVIHSDRSPKREATRRILHALRVFASNGSLDEYLYVLIPELVLESESSDIPLHVRRSALQTIAHIARTHEVTEYASRLIHSFIRTLSSGPSELVPYVLLGLSLLVQQLGANYSIFIPMTQKVVERLKPRMLAATNQPSGGSNVSARVIQCYLAMAEQLQGDAAAPWKQQTMSTDKNGLEVKQQHTDSAELEAKFQDELDSLLAALSADPESQRDRDLMDPTGVGGASTDVGSSKKLNILQENLKRAWQSTQRSTKEDWVEWMRGLSIAFLKESPSPALRACSALAIKYPPLAQELFNAAFISCWSELYDKYQDDLVKHLEGAFQARNVPQKIVQTLLSLAEFLDHDDKALPIKISTLGTVAEKFHAYAKALHYKELQFASQPNSTVEDLISINNQLQQPDAAMGILEYARANMEVKVQVSWYEKLQRWEDALATYERKQLADPMDGYCLLGRMRCLNALGDWPRLLKLADKLWKQVPDHPELAHELGPLAAAAAWNLNRWDLVYKYISVIDEKSTDGAFFRAVFSIQKGDFVAARRWIDLCRECLDPELTALVAEGYNRAYRTIVQSQQLAELEEVISYTTGTPEKQQFLRSVWERRLNGCQYDVDAWHRLLSIRTLVVPPQADVKTWIKYASLCRKNGRLHMSLRVLHNLLGVDPLLLVDDASADLPLPTQQPFVTFAALKLLWSAGFQEATYRRLREFIDSDKLKTTDEELLRLKSKCYLIAGRWRLVSSDDRPGSPQGVAAYDQDAASTESSPQLSPVPSELDLGGAGSVSASGSRSRSASPTLSSATSSSAGSAKQEPPYIRDRRGSRSSRGSRGSGRGTGLSRGSLHPPPTLTKEKQQPGGRKPIIVTTLCRPSHNKSKRKSLSGDLTAHSPMGDVDMLTASGSTRRLARGRFSSRPSIVYMGPNTYDSTLPEALEAFHMATVCDRTNQRAWHSWAVMNFRAVSHYSKQINSQNVHKHIIPGIRGFFRSIALQQHGPANSLQDILRLLTLWFEYGDVKDVGDEVIKGFGSVPLDTWLLVIPQIIARIDAHQPAIQSLVHDALIRIGKDHPQALVYPLTVASKSPHAPRKRAAERILNALKHHSPVLVSSAALVSNELIRVAILWSEQWNVGIEDSFRQLFGQHNVQGFLQTLEPLHALLRQAPSSKKEAQFQQVHGPDLKAAHEYTRKYVKNNNRKDLNRATDLYNSVLRKLHRELGQMTHLELHALSPQLMAVQNLQLAVPGTYEVGKEVVRISSFNPSLKVIESKQHPRKLRIWGSDGKEYAFLLKGHEDLRQDERVMQLFGLVNTLLSNNRETAQRDLDITRFAVVPLSPNSGLIEWVPHCDTIQALVRSYRNRRRIMVSVEQMLTISMAPDFGKMTLIQKIEAFEYALANTTGMDLCKVFWLKSPTAEIWLDRRTNYTRSLAVMSMVGYILGLGDRHTCNILIDRFSGKVVHIDFGDCFEVAMRRDRFPEVVPFRLTRMLINAMEVSGIEGNFRSTCSKMMTLLREHKESVMAVLEAFVYDPLIGWRIVESQRRQTDPTSGSSQPRGADSDPSRQQYMSDTKAHVDDRPPDQNSYDEPAQPAPEMQNQEALRIIRRVEAKLTGKDFDPDIVLDVPLQVQKLIDQATSHKNLCQMYSGWCPFW